MPDRIIRDELLRSPRYRTLSSDTTRLLFVHLLLCVDNLGNYEANPIAISDAIRRHLDDQTVSKLLTELADVDLIRLYQDEGKHYLHIPRFRQRLKYLGSKHPRPPVGIECSEIKELIDKYGLKAGHRQAVGGIEANEEKRSEEKRSDVNQDQHPYVLQPPDGTPKTTNFRPIALRVLERLNRNAGRKYHPVDANLKPIIARLKEGYTERDLCAITAVKARQWHHDEKMDAYLRPKTLFNATNAAQYRAELPANQIEEE